MCTATSCPPHPHAANRERHASACRVTASTGPAPLRTWWTITASRRLVAGALELLQPLLELRDAHRRVQVEPRLLRVLLRVVLAQDVQQHALGPRDRAAARARRAHEVDVGLDDRPLDEPLRRSEEHTSELQSPISRMPSSA